MPATVDHEADAAHGLTVLADHDPDEHLGPERKVLTQDDLQRRTGAEQGVELALDVAGVTNTDDRSTEVDLFADVVVRRDVTDPAEAVTAGAEPTAELEVSIAPLEPKVELQPAFDTQMGQTRPEAEAHPDLEALLQRLDILLDDLEIVGVGGDADVQKLEALAEIVDPTIEGFLDVRDRLDGSLLAQSDRHPKLPLHLLTDGFGKLLQGLHDEIPLGVVVVLHLLELELELGDAVRGPTPRAELLHLELPDRSPEVCVDGRSDLADLSEKLGLLDALPLMPRREGRGTAGDRRLLIVHRQALLGRVRLESLARLGRLVLPPDGREVGLHDLTTLTEAGGSPLGAALKRRLEVRADALAEILDGCRLDLLDHQGRDRHGLSLRLVGVQGERHQDDGDELEQRGVAHSNSP
ncbi:MAG: hypothetical protein A2493_00285 [Candidatus Magasanikbacteria bacterium RIFOXYC12_FULL_33_11]|uniref:Uncharacterized protein n=1 Tax=Candidatus Magasanikbacteria bacterium RIFOXYC12_FULL_33_11 TaxID=1798701 RepID=A0A1F6NQ31_9BACT|nr:MAG: hypothetical protein A2493_00285 [Candidatus Magasanikbacteria bacterium RIFOXYC12_FULL_33_11]